MRYLVSLLLLTVVVGCVKATENTLDGSSIVILESSDELLPDNATVGTIGKALIDGASNAGTQIVEATAENLIEIGSAAKGPIGLGATALGLWMYYRRRKR